MRFGNPPADSHQPPGPRPRGGLTLVELLVVIVLVSTLVATAIPVISPRGDDRKLREASRNINAYLQGAQARAVQTGRPFGVAIRRLSAETQRGEQNAIGVRMDYVEVPPTFRGFSPTSAVRLAVNPDYVPNADANTLGLDDAPLRLQFVARGVVPTGQFNLPAGWVGDLTPPRFLQPGDVIEVAGRRYEAIAAGLLYPPLGVPSAPDGTGYYPASTARNGSLLTVSIRPVESQPGVPAADLPQLNYAYDAVGNELLDAGGLERVADNQQPATPYWTEPQPYRVFRLPAPAGGEPLELPTGVAIDLQASVVGGSSFTQVYNPNDDYDSNATAYIDHDPQSADPRAKPPDPVMILFAPEGHVQRVYGVGARGGLSPAPRVLTSYLALCVGRSELIPAQPWADSSPPGTVAQPIDTTQTTLQDLPAPEQTEITDLYNWLNLESRWVVVSGQTGAIATVENSTALPAASTTVQIFSALENARSRTKMGGL